jgi:folylpolyglutamate synthase/dihydropteroate synthase
MDARSVEHGIEASLTERREDEPILIVGSHYVAGEAMQLLNAGA